jgi:hypothetical protein
LTEHIWPLTCRRVIAPSVMWCEVSLCNGVDLRHLNVSYPHSLTRPSSSLIIIFHKTTLFFLVGQYCVWMVPCWEEGEFSAQNNLLFSLRLFGEPSTLAFVLLLILISSAVGISRKDIFRGPPGD